MRIKESTVNGLFVGVLIGLFAGVASYMALNLFGSPDGLGPELANVMTIAPYFFGIAIGYYAGMFACSATKKRDEAQAKE